MPSPFPGMDPYLEAPRFWPGFHQNLIVAIQDALAPQVAPAYYVAIEENTYIVRRDQADLRVRPDVVMYRGATDPPRGGLATVIAGTTRTVLLPEYDEEREAYLEIRGVGTHEVVTIIELLSPTKQEPRTRAPRL